jgi:hypothetical protein
MKVVGLGAPSSVRARFAPCELPLVADVLRELRTAATLEAAETYGRMWREDTRAVDDGHERLREIETLLVQLDEEPPDERGRVALVARTELMSQVIHDGCEQAVRRLQTAHDHYHEHTTTAESRRALLDAANAAHAWTLTLASFDQIDQGPDT